MLKLWRTKTNRANLNFALMLALVLAVGAFLRWYHYGSFPVVGETADEQAWTYLGSSLLQAGQPTSWSYFPQYQPDHVFELDPEGRAPLVRPALDHPPLFAMLPGLAHSLRASWQVAPSSNVIRLPMVLLGVINLGLFSLLAFQFFDQSPKKTLLASVLFATIPTIVFTSRLVVAENAMLTVLLVVALSLTAKGKRWRWLEWVALALSPLIKIAALCIPASRLLQAVYERKRGELIKILLATTVGILLLLIYATWFDARLFFAVQLGQSGRDVGLTTLITRFFIHPTIVAKVFFDGWWIVGALATPFFFLYRGKQQRAAVFLQLMTLLYGVFLLTSVGETTVHSWYSIPFWPISIFAITLAVDWLWQQKQHLATGISWVMALPTLHNVPFLITETMQISATMLRLLAAFALAPILIGKGHQKLHQAWFILAFLILIGANIITITLITPESYWVLADFYKGLP